MEEQLVYYFNEYEHFAVPISIIANIIIAILGVVPSVFITGANILFFGFWQGTLLSFIGEILGAMVSFYIYRKGLKQISRIHLEKYPKLRKLIDMEGKEAFYSILSLRIIPFVPSGLVTFTASIGKVTLLIFAFASLIGKIPALLFEAYSVKQLVEFNWQGKLILTLVSIYVLYSLWKRKKQ